MRKVQRNLDPLVVQQRMAEFRKGENAFYQKYGGGPSVGYDLLDDQGRAYPPAAIVQAALGWEDVKGGVMARDSAGRALRLHGFRVVKKGERLKAPPTDAEKAFKRLKKIVETERRVERKVRIGAQTLREFALAHRIHCEVTGISDDALLRVSHIVSWSADEKNRLNPENVILLSAHWDAAFDCGLISFSDDGVVLYSRQISQTARAALTMSEDTTLSVSEERARFLARHRERFAFR